MKRLFTLITCICLFSTLRAQTGGENTYDFLELVNSARAAALGGYPIALKDSDPNLAYYNPANLSDESDQEITLNYVNYISDINLGYASYTFHKSNIGNFSAGMHYINYGKFQEATADGTKTGTFNAAEYALNLIYSRDITDRLSVGVNIKPIYSVLESYNSFGIAADLGVIYSNQSGLFNMALVAKNMGTQITTYYKNGDREDLPFDLQFGISQKLEHAPFRFMLTLNHMHDWKLGDLPGKYKEDEKDTKQFLRHATFGTEIYITPNITVRAGYNYQLRQELKIEEKTSTVGYSWGFSFKISKFRIDYGSSRYHLAGSSNIFSISTNLKSLYGR
ncbi:type IX secretion system protein PorQ [Puteibacter caeruleilacunae]|nr:type IX secretion system protein PorQ [Puteibacter caeruleilacunae]